MESNKLIEIVDVAIRAEEIQIHFFSKLARKFNKNHELSSILETIAKDKVAHKLFFHELINLAKAHKFNVDESNERFMKTVDLKRLFKELSIVGDNSEPLDVLDKAFVILRESILYYQGIKDIIGKDKDLDDIIKYCKDHFSLLSKFANKDDENYIPSISFWEY